MHAKGYWPLGRNTAELYAEYREEVENYNKKQNLLLEKHMRVIKRQERVMDSFLKKNRHEIEQLKNDIKNREPRSMNLQEYDNLKYFQKISGNGYKYKYVNNLKQNSKCLQLTPRGDSLNNSPRLKDSLKGSPRNKDTAVKLPPLWQKADGSATNRGVESRLMQDCEPKALSVRALKKSPRLPTELLLEQGDKVHEGSNREYKYIGARDSHKEQDDSHKEQDDSHREQDDSRREPVDSHVGD